MEEVIAAIGGAVVGAWLTHEIPSRRARTQLSLDLYHRFMSAEFYRIRAGTWELRRAWNAGDRSIVDYFVRQDGGQQQVDRKPEPRGPDGLVPHQYMSMVLHFYAELAVCSESGLVNTELMSKLLGNHYWWYDAFFLEFRKEFVQCRQKNRDESPLPPWFSAITRVRRIFRRGRLANLRPWWSHPVRRLSGTLRRVAPDLDRALRRFVSPRVLRGSGVEK